jgi:hypothetical protein
MISYRFDRESELASVRVNQHRAHAAGTLTKRRAVDFCRVAAAL